MLRDLITFSPDVNKLLPEVVATLPDYIIFDDKGNPIGFSITKTPTVRKGNKTLSVVRCTAAEVKLLKSLKSVEVLADVPMEGDLLAALTKPGRAKYDSVHDQTPKPVLDDKGKPVLDTNGKPVMYTPPALIGAFA